MYSTAIISLLNYFVMNSQFSYLNLLGIIMVCIGLFLTSLKNKE